MAYEELFIDLLKAEREEDVTDALTIYGLEKFSDANWLPYGGIENNYGIIGAQQADALGALVEKVVNSIDAVLMRECLARNLDPRSNLVPQSMIEAAEMFLSIPEGNLAKLSTAQRTELAERNISIICLRRLIKFRDRHKKSRTHLRTSRYFLVQSAIL
jgi:hypothetical protein